jgi:hypothetical protein
LHDAAGADPTLGRFAQVALSHPWALKNRQSKPGPKYRLPLDVFPERVVVTVSSRPTTTRLARPTEKDEFRSDNLPRDHGRRALGPALDKVEQQSGNVLFSSWTHPPCIGSIPRKHSFNLRRDKYVYETSTII